MKKLILTVVMSFFMLMLFAGALAHETPDNAADTPLASQQALDNALDNYVNAIGNSDGSAANALLRNPTCHDHHTADGIHPPGNP